MSSSQPDRPRALVLFCGGGVQHVGLHDLLDVRHAIDHDERILAAYRANHPRASRTRCVDLLDPAAVTCRRIGLSRGDVDVMQASPPCPGFSSAACENMRIADARRWLLHSVVDFAGVLKPRIVVVENVMGLANKGKARAFLGSMESALGSMGYRLARWRLDAVDFGVAQTRARLFVVGVMGGEPPPAPRPTHGDPPLPRRAVLGDVLGRMSEDEWRRDGWEQMSEHRAAILSGVRQGEVMYGHRENGRKRPSLGKPIGCLKTRPSTKCCSEAVHPTIDRHLYVREFAHLMGVPNYVFPPFLTSRERYLILGNGNPPQMMRAVYESVLGSYRR